LRPEHLLRGLFARGDQAKPKSAFLSQLPDLGFAPADHSPEVENQKIVLSPESVAILAEASRLRARTNPSWQDIGLRHLLVAFYLSEIGRPTISRGLRPDFTYDRSKEMLTGWLSGAGPTFGSQYQDDPKGWSELMKELAETNFVAPYAGYVPAFSSDRTETDLLEMEKDARALTSLVLLERLQMPLAIGLFGAWGAGKTTFMGFMKEQIGKLSGEKGLPAKVLQVQFGAWSHADAENLWASLTAGLFDQIGQQLNRGGVKAGDQLMSDIAAKIGEGTSESIKLDEEIDRAKDDLSEKTVKLSEASQTSRFQVAEKVVKQLGERAKIDQKAKKEFRNIAETLGIRDLSPEVVSTEAAKLLETSSNFVLLVYTIKRLLRTGETWAYLVGISIFILVIALLFAWFGWSAVLKSYLFTAPAFGALAWLVTIVARGVNFLSPILKLSIGLEQEVRTAQADTREKITKLGADVAEAERKLRHLQERYAEIADFRKSFGSASIGRSPAGLLRYFISFSPELVEVRRNLGLLSTVRKCFETLQDIATERRAAQDKDSAIDRIIVYIDDLDRCSENHVVQVLQAVHLLLAFDLFVVVVAVDARWLETAVARIYSHQFDPSLGDAGAATVADYLEKIFQLAVWVRPVAGAPAVRNFVNGIDRPEVTSQGLAPKQNDQPGGGGGSRPSRFETERVEPVAADALASAATRATFSDAERDVIAAMAGLVGKSPRSLKRLVNTYRLMRVMQSEEASKRSQSGDAQNPPTFPFLLFALACEVGLKSASVAAIVAALRSDPEGAASIVSLITALDQRPRDQKVPGQNLSGEQLSAPTGSPLSQDAKPPSDPFVAVREAIEGEGKTNDLNWALSVALITANEPNSTSSLQSRAYASARMTYNPSNPTRSQHLIEAFAAVSRFSFQTPFGGIG
jgi:hypothetical protein